MLPADSVVESLDVERKQKDTHAKSMDFSEAARA